MRRNDSDGAELGGPAPRRASHLHGDRRRLPDGGAVEDWLEAHRYLWSPNTVRGYATALTQWWTFLERRGETEQWNEVGVPAVSAFLSWLRNGRTAEHALVAPTEDPAPETLEARLAAVISFYRWHEVVFGVPVARRLMRGAPRRAPARGLLAHLDARSAPGPSSLVRVRNNRRRDRPPLLLPREIQAILDGCAVFDPVTGEWVGNLRDRLLFALLAESGMRIGEALGLRISDFVMGRGGTPYVEVVPRADNANGARVKMMRGRRVYVGSDLERLFAAYLTQLACTASESGVAVSADSPLLVNLERPPLLAPLREGTVRDKTAALRNKGIGPPGWTPLVPAQPCDRPAARRDRGVGGLSTARSRPRADDAGHLRLGPRGRGTARGGELDVLRVRLAGAR